MAVYTIQNKELTRVGDELENMVRDDWGQMQDCDLFMETLGFREYDGILGAYRLYVRRSNVTNEQAAELPGIKYIFEISPDDTNVECIVLQDCLPEYLAILQMLEPLVTRARDIMAGLPAAPMGNIRRH